jgi:hypothetical protein
MAKPAYAGLRSPVSGLRALCQGMGRYSPCRGMHLELRRRHMSREHARPQPPAASCHRYGGEAGEPAPSPEPRCASRGHRQLMGAVAPPPLLPSAH